MIIATTGHVRQSQGEGRQSRGKGDHRRGVEACPGVYAEAPAVQAPNLRRCGEIYCASELRQFMCASGRREYRLQHDGTGDHGDRTDKLFGALIFYACFFRLFTDDDVTRAECCSDRPAQLSSCPLPGPTNQRKISIRCTRAKTKEEGYCGALF